MRSILNWTLVCGLVGGAVWGQAADPQRSQLVESARSAALARSVDPGELGSVTVAYDAGSVVGLLQVPPNTIGGVGMVGNRFDTRSGTPLSPGTVTLLSFYQGGLGAQFGQARGLFRPTGAGTPFTQTFLGYVSAYAFNAFALTAAIPGPVTVAFLAPPPGGFFGTFGSIGYASTTLNGQGFHGIQRDFYTTGAGTMLSGQNMVVRISGVNIPVELLEFDIE